MAEIRLLCRTFRHTHNVVAEQPVSEPREETPDDKRVSSEKNQPIFLFSRNDPRNQTQASQLAGTMFFHMVLKI